MAYCLRCGAKLEEDDVICPFCGGETGGVSRIKQLSDMITVEIRRILRTEDETDEMDPYEVKAGRVPAFCGYLGVLLFVPLLIGRKNEYTHFHAGQALMLLISGILAYFSVRIAGWIMHFLPLIGEILAAALLALYWIALAVLLLIGMRNALMGRARTLPLIGRIRLFRR